MEYQNAEGNETYMACRPLTERTENHTSTNTHKGIFSLKVGWEKYLMGNSGNGFQLILLGEKK